MLILKKYFNIFLNKKYFKKKPIKQIHYRSPALGEGIFHVYSL